MNDLMTGANGTTLTARFRRLADVVESCKENANRHGERFNIFSILRVEHEENRTHSRYLAELLNPAGRHGEGSRFLVAFVKETLDLPVDVAGRIKVTRELATDNQRRVDIVVESANLIIGIEVKINAGDQKAQLYDYYSELRQRAGTTKTAVLVYLTLDGKPPSAYSLKNLEPENVRCLSFAQDIRGWLDNCVALCDNKPELSYALIQYKRLLETLTGTGASMTSLLANNLISNRNDLETALCVEKSLPQAKAAILHQFWEQLTMAMEASLGQRPGVWGGNSLKAISEDYFSKSRGGKDVGLKLPVGEVHGERVWLYVRLYNAIHYGLRVESASGVVLSSPELKKQVRDRLGQGNAQADSESDWLICFYDDPSASQEPVMLNFDKFDGQVLELLDDDNRQTVIGNMVNHQAKLIKAALLLDEDERT